MCLLSYAEARWPNLADSDDLLNRADFRPIAKDAWTAGQGGTSAILRDAGIPEIPGGWAGGTIWYIGWFIPQTSTIAASSAGQIEFPSKASEQFRDSFYLTGKLGALDAEKEWFYDGGKLYLWAPGGGPPANVEVKRRNDAFDLSGKSHITIRNLRVIAAAITTDATSANVTLDGIRARYISHFVTLSGKDVLYSHSDESGIRLMGPNSAICNSIVEFSAGHGIVLGGEGCVADNNLIHDISYGGTYCCGIFPAPGNARQAITRNTIYRTGRSGIDGVYSNKEIAHNDIYGFGLLNTDLGAIYSARNTDLTGTRIHHNWLHDAGNDAGHPFPVGAGIYFDQNAKPAQIDHNVFWKNHMNDVRLEQAKPPFHWVFNNTLASTDAKYWFAFHSYPGGSSENLNNNIYRAPTDPDKPGTNEMNAATDPKFTNAGEGGLKFRLQADSPAIDRGAVIPGVTDGHTGTAPDLGAYEYGGTDWVAGCNLSLTLGLISWWKLDEKSGTAAFDSSGRGNHGILIGGPTWADGRIGGALHFANTDDTKIYVDIPNNPSLENVQERDWTVAAWVWPDSLPRGTKVTPAYGIIIKQGQHIGLVYDQDGLFKMQHHSAAGYSLAKSATKPPKAWYHVAGVVSKSNGFVKIYVNGKLESAVNFAPGARAVEFGTRTWKLGIAAPDYTNFREAMNGKVDDVRIYSRALSDAEIAALAAQEDPQSADRNDWPQFRGPNRDGKSPETGLLKVWPHAGPRLLHTITGVGGGFSSPVIAGGRIYITGKVGDDLKIFCFDGSGRKIWERTHAPAFSEANAPHSPYPGARATPTIDRDMIYLLGGLGRLTAYRTSNGEPVWSVDVVGELGGRVPPWGYAESVLIDGDKLICTPGGE